MEDLEFEWDEGNLKKIAANALNRDIDREEAESVFIDPQHKIAPNKHPGEEARLQIIGLSNKNRFITVIFVVRNGRIRYVTAWPTKRKERPSSQEG